VPVADESFAGEEERLEAADAAHLEIEVSFEGDDVAGVDGEAAVDRDRQHAPVGVDEEIAVPRALEQGEAFSAEQGAEASELQPGVDGACAGEVGAGLNEELLAALERLLDDVSRERRREHNLTSSRRAEAVHEDGLATEELPEQGDDKGEEDAKEPSAPTCVQVRRHFDGGRTGHHRASFCLDLISGGQGDLEPCE
jgi:hypothetical protein